MVSKSALIIFRVLQVLISLAFCITTGLALAGLAGFYHWFNQPGRYNTVTSDWKLTQKEVNNVKTGLVGGMAGVGLLLAVCLLSFFLTVTWLCYTASPRARSRAHCCGNHVVCVRYTCDLTWDILLLIFWALMLAAVAGGLAFYPKLVDFVNKEKAAVVARHIPRDSLPEPLKNLQLDNLTQPQRDMLLKVGEAAGVVSKTDVSTYMKLNKGAEVFLSSGRIVLIVAVAMAAFQVVSFIITAALSSANRNTLRGESDAVAVLPVCQAPKQVVDMGRLQAHAGVAAKPIVYW